MFDRINHYGFMKRIAFVSVLFMLALASCAPEAGQPKVLAHRGFCTENGKVVTDENTLDALIRAQQAHVDGIEFDVHLTADDSLIIRHDNKITDVLSCQTSKFADIRAHVLPFGHQIPTLQEWLDQAMKTPEIPLAIEVKSHATLEREAEVVAGIIREVRLRGMEQQVKLLSFKPATCDEMLRQAPDIRVVLNANSLHHSLDPDEAAARGYYGVSYGIEVTLNHPEWIQRSRELGIETYFWMVDSRYLRDLGAELGVDWITTDFYDLIRW